VEEITVTEGARFQAGFYAASARFAAVFIGAFYVLASIVREFDDKGLDMILALDLPRSHYVLGKLAGFLGIAAVLSAPTCVPLLWLAPPPAPMPRGVSLPVCAALWAAGGVVFRRKFTPVRSRPRLCA